MAHGRHLLSHSLIGSQPLCYKSVGSCPRDVYPLDSNWSASFSVSVSRSACLIYLAIDDAALTLIVIRLGLRNGVTS